MKDYFGATIGRYANRIARGKFTLDKTNYQLAINNPPNALHGGMRGFDKRMWNAESVDSDIPAIRFTYLSKDGEEGYPGNLFVSVTFSLNDDNELRITYSRHHRQADHPQPDQPLLLQSRRRPAARSSTTASPSTPTSSRRSTTRSSPPARSRMWPARPTTSASRPPPGAHIKELKDKPQGYDFNYVLNKGFFSNWALAAVVEDPATGRRMEVSTDQPGIQFYTGNFLTGSYVGREHKRYPQYGSICLETQHFPDSPNHDNFPTTILRPGEDFQSSTVYAFSTEK